MTYFSRLTEIVTCNLNSLLAESEDQALAIREIIQEMEEGVGGARRSCQTAASNEHRLTTEMDAHRTQIAFWTAKAREELGKQTEELAREALLRKREIEDLVAALQQQQAAASATREQLQTTLRALEARLADARRKELELAAVVPLTDTKMLDAQTTAMGSGPRRVELDLPVDKQRAAQIEDDLEALRREMQQ